MPKSENLDGGNKQETLQDKIIVNRAEYQLSREIEEIFNKHFTEITVSTPRENLVNILKGQQFKTHYQATRCGRVKNNMKKSYVFASNFKKQIHT